MEVEILGGYSSEKKAKSSFRYNKNKATEMINMLTYFVNIHAHSSIKHTSSRVESLELLQTKLRKLPSI